MIAPILDELFVRDLQRLKNEVLQYSSDEALWRVGGGINNSGGNLCLHLIGNLRTFIGSGLAGVDYVRDREYEFGGDGISRASLAKEVDLVSTLVSAGFERLSTDQFLKDTFPVIIWDDQTSMAFTIIHLQGHLNYHLGQINYHRRLLDDVE